MSDRLEKLKLLQDKLELSLETCEDKSLAAIARQYRETMREIEELEGADMIGDGIGDILSARQADGDPTADRKNRSGIRQDRRA